MAKIAIPEGRCYWCRDGDGLERASGEIEHAGQLARLEFQRMYGEQEAAFPNTLPLCRGLR